MSILLVAGMVSAQDSDPVDQTGAIDAGLGLVDVTADGLEDDGLEKILADVSQHVLEEGEVIQVVAYTTFHELEFNTKGITVKRNGLVTVPLIGEVLVAGKTIETAQKEIWKRLEKDYLVDPKVEVNLIRFAPKKFMVLGKVARPGSYTFSAEDEFTILDAVTKAGGLLPIGNPKNIMIQREVNGETTIIENLNIEKMAQDIKVKPVKIEDGDVITIHEKWL